MSKTLTESIKSGDITEFKSSVYAILKEKTSIKIEEIKQKIISEIAINQSPEDFFYTVGAEDYIDMNDHISVIFPNKSSLQLALKSLPDDLEYEIYYYDDIHSDVDLDVDDEYEDENIELHVDQIPDIDSDAALELVIYKDDDGDFEFKDEWNESVEHTDLSEGWNPDSIVNEANENESGRLVKRKVSFSKKKKGGKLVSKRQRRRKGKISKGVGGGYKAKGAGWKNKQIQASRKRKISKKINVKAQKIGKRFAKRSMAIRKKLGYKTGT